jgi:hypothetical protein
MKEIQAYPKDSDNLHQIVSVFYDVQHLRITILNRFNATKFNELANYVKYLSRLENDIVKYMKKLLEGFPISEWILKQKGISYSLAGQLVGIIGDIGKFDNVSSLWRYFGLAVVDECTTCHKRYWPPDVLAYEMKHTAERLAQQWERKIVKDEDKPDFMERASKMFCHCEHPNLKRSTQRPKEGVLGDYNPKAKTLAFKIATQFVKQNEEYKSLYDTYRKKLEQRNDRLQEVEKKKGKLVKSKNGEMRSTSGTMHIHMDAQRRMVKEFLKNLWLEWRRVEGLPITQPYAVARLGHTDHTARRIEVEVK